MTFASFSSGWWLLGWLKAPPLEPDSNTTRSQLESCSLQTTPYLNTLTI